MRRLIALFVVIVCESLRRGIHPCPVAPIRVAVRFPSIIDLIGSDRINQRCAVEKVELGHRKI
jgi:hypothetical protein